MATPFTPINRNSASGPLQPSGSVSSLRLPNVRFRTYDEGEKLTSNDPIPDEIVRMPESVAPRPTLRVEICYSCILRFGNVSKNKLKEDRQFEISEKCERATRHSACT